MGLDSFCEAWRTLKWDLSFTISDIISLIAILATAVLAFLTFRIQREMRDIEKRNSAYMQFSERYKAYDNLKKSIKSIIISNERNNDASNYLYKYSNAFKFIFDKETDEYIEHTRKNIGIYLDYYEEMRKHHLAIEEKSDDSVSHKTRHHDLLIGEEYKMVNNNLTKYRELIKETEKNIDSKFQKFLQF